MSDKQVELEKQVANLTAEVARLRRIILIGFSLLGIFLAFAFFAPGLIFIVFAAGIVLWGVAFIGATLGSALSRRSQRKRSRFVLIPR